jgi:ATP-dependent RNA helicase DDX24/MAK5
MAGKLVRDQEITTKRPKKVRKVDRRPAPSSNDHSGSFIKLDDLHWKESQLPDRLGDAEGFFGLEEVDGIEIVRSSTNGAVKFKVRFL